LSAVRRHSSSRPAARAGAASSAVHPPPAPARQRILTVVGFAVTAALASTLFFFHLGVYGLWEPDEARYAEIAREMLAMHEFVVPHLNYVAYLEKPPLLYWLTACSMRLFGINEFAARLPNAVAALAGVLVTYFFVLRTFDRSRAILAATILATSGLYALMAQVLTTDLMLTAIITVALFACFLHWRDGGSWCWLSYAAIGLAVLTKGPIGAVLPIVAGAIFLWWEGELSGAIRRFHLVAGMGLAAVISIPWFIAITLREPGFFGFYFVGEHFRRFFESSYSHGQPVYYYAPVIAAALLPWTLFVPFIPWRSLDSNPVRRFCVIVATVIFVVFSAAGAKLIPYILPAIPPLAVILADAIALHLQGEIAGGHLGERFAHKPDPRRLAAIGPLLGLGGVGVMLTALNADRFASPNPTMVRPALYFAGAIVVAGGIGCFVIFWYRRVAAGLAVFAAVAAATLLTASYGRILAEPARSYARLARDLQLRAPDTVLVCYPRYIQSLPFYCRRRVSLVGAKTELAYGAEHATDASQYFFTRRTDLLRLWNQPRPTVIVIDRWALPPLAASFGPLKVIASDAKKLAIMRLDASRGEKAIK
jgi:4-amino-4-deoxy-L-arabinose transferase-like glycosyltransferase